MTVPSDTSTVSDHYQAQPDATIVPILKALLREARMALPAEFCGGPGTLADRIDDVLCLDMPPCVYCGVEGRHWSQDCLSVAHVRAPHDRNLVWERLPNGEFGWLRA